VAETPEQEEAAVQAESFASEAATTTRVAAPTAAAAAAAVGQEHKDQSLVVDKEHKKEPHASGRKLRKWVEDIPVKVFGTIHLTCLFSSNPS
jgi:hypothetical protein